MLEDANASYFHRCQYLYELSIEIDCSVGISLCVFFNIVQNGFAHFKGRIALKLYAEDTNVQSIKMLLKKRRT